tara:strand:- start:48033 stop:50039 length:2007 start_codon:yes stop_codon:yes gene_type:complete
VKLQIIVSNKKLIKMKKILLTIIVLFCFNSFSQESIVMTINDKEITKSEFLQIYLKNNNNPKYDQESLDEYMELFKKFKLKVAEAEALGYDTIPKLVKELSGYHKQLALPYLTDSSMNEYLVKEAYNRTKQEVRASHILVKILNSTNPNDTLKAYNKIMQLRKRILSGESFEDVAKGDGGSDDPSVKKNGGDLGFFTAFQMVYPFEEQAYKTDLFEISMPFKTRFGYHILKVTDKRPAKGTIETAHIMIAVNRNANKEEVENAKLKIEEIYHLLEQNKDFDSLVIKYSDDPSSKKNKGILPAFGTGTSTRMVPEFEEAAFELKNNGDISKPIRTDYGFHIIKRLNLTDVPPFEKLEKNLKKKVSKDIRSKETQNSFIKKLKKEYKYKKYNKGINWFYNNIDSSYWKGESDISNLEKNKALFKLDNRKFYQKDFGEYLKSNYRGFQNKNLKSHINLMYYKWEKETILNYEESKLKIKYPDFKALITEYHDGILLYEIMSDKVWNKAIKDTLGLKEFYNNNTSKYMWDERIDADIYICENYETANKVKELHNNWKDFSEIFEPSTIVDSINGNSKLKISHIRKISSINKTAYLANQNFGSASPLNIYEHNGKYYTIFIHEFLESSQKKFNEAKGAITSDYQDFLEKEWLEEIAKKHTIKINKEALYSIGK